MTAASVAILLCPLRRLALPIPGNPTVFDRRLLVVGQMLSRPGDDRGIDDLFRHGEIADVLQFGVEASEQRLDRLGFGQSSAARPDRVGIRNPITKAQAQKPLEAQPILDPELGLFVRERVKGLQNQNMTT